MENINAEVQLEEKSAAEKEALNLRTNKGFKVILWGAVILLISGLIAIFTPLSDTGFEVVMYGITSLGSVMIMYGLYLVLG